jgi:hypothetical protein
MRRSEGISKLRFKKLKEMLTAVHGKWHSFNRTGDIRYGKNAFEYAVHPKFTSPLEFCVNVLPGRFNVSSVKHNYTIDQIIDLSYSNFILGEYNVSDQGADYKFNTIRNVFKNNFKSKEYMVNHYSNKLLLPVIKFLKKEFADRDYLNIAIPIKVNAMVILRNIESGIRDYVRKEFNLVRAGPFNIESHLLLVA